MGFPFFSPQAPDFRKEAYAQWGLWSRIIRCEPQQRNGDFSLVLTLPLSSPRYERRKIVGTDDQTGPHQQKITQIEILSGWKDIANYLGQGVRTVQRYERDLGLPVRRTAGRCKGAVIATKAEIDAWISARPLRQGLNRSLPASNNTEIFEAFRNQLADLHRLRVEAAQLRTEMRASRQALKMSIELLHETLRVAVPQSPQRHRTADILIFDPKRKIN